MYNGHPKKMARWPLYTGNLCRKYKATENFGKLSGDRNILVDHYILGSYIKVDCVLPNSSFVAFITSNIFKFQQQHTLSRWNSQFILISVDNNHLIDIYQFGTIVVINFIPFDNDILVSLLYRQKLAQKACIRVKQVLKKDKRVMMKRLLSHFSYVFDSSRAAVLPTKVHQWVITLIYIHQSFPFVWRNSWALHSHLPSSKFDEIFRRRPPGMAEQSLARHVEKPQWVRSSRIRTGTTVRQRLGTNISGRVQNGGRNQGKREWNDSE